MQASHREKTPQLDKNRILELLAKADIIWYKTRSDRAVNYRAHLEFTAEYIAKNYLGGKGGKKD